MALGQVFLFEYLVYASEVMGRLNNPLIWRCYLDWSSITPAVVIAVSSLFTAWCSFFVALSNYRRSNYAIIKIITTSSTGGCAVNRGNFHEFRLVIQNFGIPLHNVGVSLSFSPDGFGTARLPLKIIGGEMIRQGQFAKGAISEFKFATDMMDKFDFSLIKSLKELKPQRMHFILHEDSYAMWTYPLADQLWWLKRKWNIFACRVNWRMSREVVTPRGTKGMKSLLKIPEFESPGQELLNFATTIRAESN